MDTKNKIVVVAEQLFFEYGIAGTRLQQIADAAGISVGNLAYHFKNKEAIVETVYENLFTELSGILSEYMIYQQLSGFDKQFSAMYRFYEHQNFVFNNSWEIARNYPAIQKEWLSVTNKIVLQLKKRIDKNIEYGIFKPESYKGAYNMLCHDLLLTINCWIPQQILRGKPSTEDLFKRHLWNILYPVLTEKGQKEFENIIVPLLY